VDGVCRHAAWIVLGSALFTVACALYAARNLGVETDTEVLFDPELPFRRLESQLDAAFPMREDALIVVLDAPGAARASAAAEALAARLAAQPELYADVFAPGVGPFFERHGLLYEDLDEIEELVDRLVSAQPFLAEVSRDPSLRGLFRMFERALDQATAAAGRGLDLEKALAEVELAAREAASRRVRHLGFDELLVSSGGEGAARRYVLVQPRIDYSELVPAREALERLRATFVELGFGPGGDVRARFTGNLALSAEELEITRRQSALAGAASFALVTAILMLALRSPRLVVATMATAPRRSRRPRSRAGLSGRRPERRRGPSGLRRRGARCGPRRDGRCRVSLRERAHHHPSADAGLHGGNAGDRADADAALA
jgi:hypothetical protein